MQNDSNHPPPSFDLRDQKWIGAITNESELIELGLREILLRAHELRAVSDPLPTVECGVLRLLVALALDIFAPRDTKDLAELIEAESFDTAKVNDYFELHAERFDLFHRQWPFLQTPMESEKASSSAGLLSIIPSGTNTLHFHHEQENTFQICPEAAARLLTLLPAFAQGNQCGKGPPSINGAPPFYVLLQGDTLFETILLNCPADESLLPHAKRENDFPVWRSDEPIKAQDQSEAGVLQSLTWAPRRIQLIPREGGSCSLTGRSSPVLVGAMKVTAGWSSRFENWTDPHVPYRVAADKVTVLRPQEERPLWRDAGPLAMLRAGDYQSQSGSKFRFERPSVISQFADMRRRDELPKEQALCLTVYGVRTDLQAKVFEWHRAHLRVPLPLVLNGDFASRAQGEMDKAQGVASVFRTAILSTHPKNYREIGDAQQKGKIWKPPYEDEQLRLLITRARRDFWDELEPHFLNAPNSLLEDLARLQDASEAEREARVNAWRETVRQTGKRVLDEAIEDLDGDADALERQVAARNIFAASVHNVLFPPTAEEMEERKSKKKSVAKKGAAHAAN